ncbi:MAG: hypothetical protein ACLR23_26105 [Clostridia bacterium]
MRVTQGKDAERDNEIVISEGYAVANAVSIGSRMKIGDKEYTVAGFMQRPDYLYMLESEEDAYKNVSTFYLCYMTGSAFEALGDTGCQYLVRYTGDSDITGFRKAVHEQYYMRSYSSAAENPRITMVEQQAQMFIVMAYVLLCILPLIAVVLISIIISRKVKSEQRMIGTLSALGYKGTADAPLCRVCGDSGTCGRCFTAIISAIAAQPLSEMGLQDYEPMHVAGHLNPLAALLGLLVPTALYVIAALLSVRRLLKRYGAAAQRQCRRRKEKTETRFGRKQDVLSNKVGNSLPPRQSRAESRHSLGRVSRLLYYAARPGLLRFHQPYGRYSSGSGRKL